MDRLEEIEALEELADIKAFDTAMVEEGPNIPWENVVEDLSSD